MIISRHPRRDVAPTTLHRFSDEHARTRGFNDDAAAATTAGDELHAGADFGNVIRLRGVLVRFGRKLSFTLVHPLCGDAELGGVVHGERTHLYLERGPVRAVDGGVQRAIAGRLRIGDVVVVLPSMGRYSL